MSDRKKLMLKYAAYPGAAFLLTLIIESLNRKSLFEGLGYMAQSPLLFCFNALIILLTLLAALFFRREIFVFCAISVTWLLFGIADFVLLHFRTTPFSAVDFKLIKTAISVSGHYLSALDAAMVVFAVAVVCVCLCLLYRKAPRNERRAGRRFAAPAVLVFFVASALVLINSRSSSVKALSASYTNISEAYENYGFVYCFTNSIIDAGIAKPEGYSEEAVRSIKASLKDEKNSVAAIKDGGANIIFLQLESFFDVDCVKGLDPSRDPVPVFHSLRDNFSSGLVTVPTVGAGTVNTEFEVLTGLRQRDFGVCEYPYKTVLKNKAVESACTDLSALGYKCHAVHNNEAAFYGRNVVFSNLGFDTFTSMEYMNGVSENENGWAKDDVMPGEIIKALDSTKGKDFVFGITVQSHGRYDVDGDGQYPIKVSGAPHGMNSQYAYYVNQIAEVDKMIGELIDALDKRGEKTMLVLYGDHLPSLELEEGDLENADLYQTQYATWNNFGLKKRDRNVAAYQLYPMIFDTLGIHDGLICRYHQQARRGADYLKNLTMLAYDGLYGENYAYGGRERFFASNLKMGVSDVAIEDVTARDGVYEAIGTGFTPYCRISLGGRELKTEWIDETRIRIKDDIDGGAGLSFTLDVKDGDGILLSENGSIPYERTSVCGAGQKGGD